MTPKASAKTRASAKTKAFERALKERTGEQYRLHLYVAGMTDRSTRAVSALKALCESEIKGRYDLEVIDLCKQPGLAKKAEIIVAPTLIKSLPLPLRRLVGDLSQTDRVLVGLDLRTAEKAIHAQKSVPRKKPSPGN